MMAALNVRIVDLNTSLTVSKLTARYKSGDMKVSAQLDALHLLEDMYLDL